MFSLPTPYAQTAKGRNIARDAQVLEALKSARANLAEMLEEMDTLINGVQDPTLWQEPSVFGVDLGLAYGRASYVSRDVMHARLRLRDFDENTTRAMVIAGGYEVEETTEPLALEEGDKVIVDDPSLGKQRGTVRIVDEQGAYIEGPQMPGDSRHVTWTIATDRIAQFVTKA